MGSPRELGISHWVSLWNCLSGQSLWLHLASSLQAQSSSFSPLPSLLNCFRYSCFWPFCPGCSLEPLSSSIAFCHQRQSGLCHSLPWLSSPLLSCCYMTFVSAKDTTMPPSTASVLPSFPVSPAQPVLQRQGWEGHWREAFYWASCDFRSRQRSTGPVYIT